MLASQSLGSMCGVVPTAHPPGSSHRHGLCILVFSFQQSHPHCLMLLLDLELSFSLTHTMDMGSFGKGLSLMWDTHPHPAPESCTHCRFSYRIPEQEKGCGPCPKPCPGPPQRVILLRLPIANSIPNSSHSMDQGFKPHCMCCSCPAQLTLGMDGWMDLPVLGRKWTTPLNGCLVDKHISFHQSDDSDEPAASSLCFGAPGSC